MGLKLEKPQYKNISTFPPEKTVYNKHEEFQFNITWNDNVNLSKVLFFFNGIEHIPTCLPDFPVNKTHCTITLYNLTYGNHHYSWWANDTNGHENSTGGISYVLYEKEPKTSTAPTSLIGTLINSVLITLDLEKITMNSDETEKIQITLFNDGNTYLGNLELSAEGLPEASYLFSDNSTSLDANQSATIYMDIIPESLEGDYEIEIIVNNSATKSSAILQLTVNKILSERELQHETKETQPLFQEIETQTEDGAITGLFISPLENTPTTQLVIAGIAVAILLAFLFKNKIIGLFLR